MKAPKILAVASAVDLDFRYGCTPAWWQLWKGLYEVGVDLIVTPYRGRPVESPWWRTAPNPTYAEGESFAAFLLSAEVKSANIYACRAQDRANFTDHAGDIAVFGDQEIAGRDSLDGKAADARDASLAVCKY
jgi:hypothetical protein